MGQVLISCPRVKHSQLVGAYGPLVSAPLSIRWLWVPNKKNRPSYIFLPRYREQIASILPNQVLWQSYEAELRDLPTYCIARREMWTARVPLVCFHLVEKHTPNCVTYHASPNPNISPPTPRSFPKPALLSPIPSFDLGIDFNPTPLVMHTESPFHTIGHIDHGSLPPTSSTGSSLAMDPLHADHVQSEAQHQKVGRNTHQKHLLVE